MVTVTAQSNRKIDIYVNGEYRASTTWCKTVREAVDRYTQAYPMVTGNITGRFSNG